MMTTLNTRSKSANKGLDSVKKLMIFFNFSDPSLVPGHEVREEEPKSNSATPRVPGTKLRESKNVDGVELVQDLFSNGFLPVHTSTVRRQNGSLRTCLVMEVETGLPPIGEEELGKVDNLFVNFLWDMRIFHNGDNIVVECGCPKSATSGGSTVARVRHDQIELCRA